MLNLKTLKHKSKLKRVLYAILILILFLCAWLAFVIFHDESPDAGRDAFYAVTEKPVPDHQNLAVAISGLNAPEGKDSIKHGRFLIDASKNDLTRDAARFFANGPAKLNFVGKRDEFECWLDDKLEKTTSNCASAERIKALLVANKTLLARYQQLYKIKNWHGNTFGGGKTIIDINVLLAAEIKLDIDEGRPEIAYKKWRDNFQFISRTLAAKVTPIERAIFLVADTLSLKSIEKILLKSPETSIQHYDELQTWLKPSGLERYNIKNMLRAEYEFVNNEFIIKRQNIYYFHPNFIRNRIYRLQMDFFESAQKNPKSLTKISKRFKEQYQSDSVFNINLCDPFNSYLANKIIAGFTNNFALIESMHHHNSIINTLNLLTQIRVNKIETENIQGFINKTGAKFRNPFTEKPLLWNAEKAAIIYQNPSIEENIEFKL